MSDFNPADLNNLELAHKIQELLIAQEHIEAGVRVLKDEMLDRLIKDGSKAFNIGSHSYTIANFNSYPELTIEKARELGATKVETKESIDTAKVKKLVEAGADIKVEVTPRLTIRNID